MHAVWNVYRYLELDTFDDDQNRRKCSTPGGLVEFDKRQFDGGNRSHFTPNSGRMCSRGLVRHPSTLFVPAVIRGCDTTAIGESPQLLGIGHDDDAARFYLCLWTRRRIGN